jgi:putative ABC transport system permease protein
MSFSRRLLLRFYSVIRPGRAERQLAREITAHLALLEDSFRERGMTPEEARVAARRAFGGVDQAKELQREARSFAWLDDGKRDVAYALRTLGRTPGFTTVAVLTLALGIGSVTIIYSVIHNVLLDPLPYRHSDRLVNVFVQDLETGRIARSGFPAPEFLDYQEGSGVFEEVVGTMGVGMMYTGRERAEYLRAVWVTPNFFDFMGLPPLIGRAIVPEDGRADAPPVAVLRHRAWVSYFGADPDIVGKTVVLNGEARTIVGVMPPRFTWHAADLWVPKAIERSATDAQVPFRNFQARLKTGVTLKQAEAQLNLIAARRAREHPKEYPDKFQIQVLNIIAFTVGEFSRVLYTTLAAVGLLLLIACCNVANMLLARATVREREMTVRAALGAGRGRIVRQLLVESLLLGLSGAAAGCLLAYAGLDALVSLLPQYPLPGEVEIALDGAALVFGLVTAVVSALLFGIAPALYSARRDLVEGLKSGGKGLAGGRGRLRNALVTAEIALSMVLLLGAGLLMRTFISLVRVDLGFNPEKILVVPVAFAPGAYATAAEKHRFYEHALQRIAALSGVEAASATTYIPPYDGPSNHLTIPGRALSGHSPAVVQSCTEDHFRTLGIRILRGRGLPELAAGELPRTAVVNQTFVSSYFRDEDPIGKHFRLSSPPPVDGLIEIVGVVEDVKNQGIRNSPAPHVYLPGATAGRSNPVILVRTVTDPLDFLNAVRGEIAIVDRQVALRQPGSLQEVLQRGLYSQPRFSLIVLGLFAVTGTLLVAIGVFSVMAYTVSQQTKEIAVRMALGAGRRHVLGVVLRLGTQLLGAGAAAGLLASAATGRLIANQLWNTSPHDPMTLAAATSVIAVVALAACYIPARRAMMVDPIAALRHD